MKHLKIARNSNLHLHFQKSNPNQPWINAELHKFQNFSHIILLLISSTQIFIYSDRPSNKNDERTFRNNATKREQNKKHAKISKLTGGKAAEPKSNWRGECETFLCNAKTALKFPAQFWCFETKVVWRAFLNQKRYEKYGEFFGLNFWSSALFCKGICWLVFGKWLTANMQIKKCGNDVY